MREMHRLKIFPLFLFRKSVKQKNVRNTILTIALKCAQEKKLFFGLKFSAKKLPRCTLNLKQFFTVIFGSWSSTFL